MTTNDRVGNAVGRYRMSVRLALLLKALVFLMLCSGLSARATDGELHAQQHKISAAYLYHFLQLVKWPDENGAAVEKAFNVCIFGRDPFGEVIDAIARKKARGREVAIRRIQEIKRVDDCHLLYVSSSHAADFSAVLKAVEGMGVLTVSDIRDFVAQGGMIGFVTVADESESGFRVRFEINLDVARKRGFKINSKLLELATYVRQ